MTGRGDEWSLDVRRVVTQWSAGAHLHQYYQEPDTGQWYNTKGIAIIQRGLFPVLYSHADQRSTITHFLTCRHSDMQVEDCKTSREGFCTVLVCL